MKYILSFFLTLSVLCTSLSAVEYGGLSTNNVNNYPEYIVLNEGDFLEIIGCTSSEINYNHFAIYTINSNVEANVNASQIEGYIASVSTDKVTSGQLDTFVGPTIIKLCRNMSIGSSHGGNFVAFYKLTRASEVEYKQANIVSLPADTVGAGTHEIVVEASDDLQTWTPVHSSSIGGNKAFFRTRVVEAGD
jgi:hypothetical protein